MVSYASLSSKFSAKLWHVYLSEIKDKKVALRFLLHSMLSFALLCRDWSWKLNYCSPTVAFLWSTMCSCRAQTATGHRGPLCKAAAWLWWSTSTFDCVGKWSATRTRSVQLVFVLTTADMSLRITHGQDWRTSDRHRWKWLSPHREIKNSVSTNSSNHFINAGD